MKNITISIDAKTHRLARIMAAERDMSVSALVRHYLQDLARGRDDNSAETERERRRRRIAEVFEDIRSTRSGFSASDNLSREELYESREVR